MRQQSFIPGTGLVAVERLLNQAQRWVGIVALEWPLPADAAVRKMKRE